MDRPLYKHECEFCVYLGAYKAWDGYSYDLYYCPQDGVPTVLARWSNDSWAYTSGMNNASAPLAEAKRRVTKQNLPLMP